VNASGVTEPYGFGAYRAVLRASTSPGVVHAFYTQGNDACADANCNDSEVDVEIVRGDPRMNSGTCHYDPDAMYVLFTNWTAAGQGDRAGDPDRRETSVFRFDDPREATQFHTYGFDWDKGSVTYFIGGANAVDAARAIALHTRYVPRRAAPVHLQVWNACWAGAPAGDGVLEARRVLYEPARSESCWDAKKGD
jgi:beta-glucanase (GH16 family)